MDILNFLLIAAIPASALAGWYLREWKMKRDNRKIAAQMAASVGAVRSRRKPEDMLEYDYRQRTKAPNTGKKVRQGIVRPRRVMRRPDTK
jgi:hypothetical protein